MSRFRDELNGKPLHSHFYVWSQFFYHRIIFLNTSNLKKSQNGYLQCISITNGKNRRHLHFQKLQYDFHCQLISDDLFSFILRLRLTYTPL